MIFYSNSLKVSIVYKVSNEYILEILFKISNKRYLNYEIVKVMGKDIALFDKNVLKLLITILGDEMDCYDLILNESKILKRFESKIDSFKIEK